MGIILFYIWSLKHLKTEILLYDKGLSSQAMAFPVMYGCESWTIS